MAGNTETSFFKEARFTVAGTAPEFHWIPFSKSLAKVVFNFKRTNLLPKKEPPQKRWFYGLFILLQTWYYV